VLRFPDLQTQNAQVIKSSAGPQREKCQPLFRSLKTRRFQTVKTRPGIFFIYWTVQAVWVIVTALPVLLVNSINDRNPEFEWTDYCGWAIWVIGFLIEAIADYQKFIFRSSQQNKDKFISSGLWKYSRHPNYFGDILTSFGTYLACVAPLQGWQHLAVVSPVFVWWMLSRLSGVPMLERQADKRWKGNLQYEEYKRRTNVLIPWPFK